MTGQLHVLMLQPLLEILKHRKKMQQCYDHQLQYFDIKTDVSSVRINWNVTKSVEVTCDHILHRGVDASVEEVLPLRSVLSFSQIDFFVC